MMIMREIHKIMMRLRTGIMHDIILYTYASSTHVSTEAPDTCNPGHRMLR